MADSENTTPLPLWRVPLAVLSNLFVSAEVRHG
ncbi:hypothetical protein FBZ83_1285 [Azospirillum brasilense]|uniref:Uncharacterized protein n=1 Tax=Azospirillum brasilense TaxID=192 RepID=A0A560BM96_AZOBR|nr:hypothetical protein FBZ83_1285 [Azospirillum brasilense]